jgi:glycosyltransferase involved in cell wall biosynthesis
VSTPLRVLFLDEGVLGHRTLTAQLRSALADDPAVEATFATVPPPNRLERLLLRRWRRAGDADLFALRWRLRWSWRARRILKRNLRAVDVAFINTQAAALLMRRPMRRLPCVLSIDATVGQFTALRYFGPGDSWTPRQQRLLERLERRALAGAATVVAWTEWNAEALRREYDLPASKLVTLHPGLDRGWWEAAGAGAGGRDEGPLRVLFVGNEVERKGLGTLVEAVRRLGGAASLDVVSGDPVESDELVRVHRGVAAGSEELRGLYASAEALALPTRADAVPWVVLEAMAAGLPVVASPVGAIPELVGDGGVLVEPEDADGLAAALRDLTDPARRTQLGEAALARVGERYDSAIQLPQLLQVLRDAAGPATEGSRTRMRRRTFVGIGIGVAGLALAAPYALLLTDDEFEQLVASHLGIDQELAEQLLERARENYGEAEYDAHAFTFALAVRAPAATVMPHDAREKAIEGLLEPMLSAPASNLAYATNGSDPGPPAPCGGLRRPL